MENKDIVYQLIANDAAQMNNGDNMVDVSTAYLAIDRARSDERHQLLAGWEPTTKPIPTTDLVDVLFSDGTIREIVGDHISNWVYPYIKVGYAVAWRLRDGDVNVNEIEK
ncbi:hypothetical protein [Alistipes finegoldii]|jgi:hypothetical protein|uniref:hypothetical protein n=1 Tax=Alistipes finegoldii TaxID=214856 RepID=UPI00242BE7CE|nr:hypothetical protein [Alistipes finegoldii]